MLDFIPNQKTVRINREKVDKVSGNGRLFLLAYQDNILEAMKLSHTTFKVYIYFLFHKDGFNVAFSPEYIRKATNVCKETARKAFKELQEKGYIVSTHKGYEFFEYPRFSANLLPVGEKREFIDNETGEIFNYSYNQLVAAVGEEKAALLWESDNNVSE